MKVLAAVCLSLLVTIVSSGTAPSSPNAARFNVVCPSTLAAFDNSVINFNYTPTAAEVVQESFVYDPSGCTGSLSNITGAGANGTVTGSINGSCAATVASNTNQRYIFVAMQYGNVFQSSDHLYGLYCEYSYTQKLNNAFTIANPQSFVSTDNMTEPVNNVVASETFSIQIHDNATAVATNGTVRLGDSIFLQLSMTTNVYQGFYIQSITAKSGDETMTYNMTQNRCQTPDASSDGIMAEVDSQRNFTATVKQTMDFQAFRFMNQLQVKFDIVVSLCFGPNDAACISAPQCSGVSGRRRREAPARVARQTGASQTGTLETVMYVVGRDEGGRTIVVPVSNGNGAGAASGGRDKTETARGGDACVTTLHLAIIGALALFLIVIVVVFFVVVLRRRQHGTKKEDPSAGFGGKHQ